METSGLLKELIDGKPRAIARAISRVEDGSESAAELMRGVYGKTGKATVIGITGSPGAGKSSLVDKLAFHYRDLDKTVGIICVDPSSPFSGGAILGDRIRMQELGLDSGVFIRSMATRGNLGGLARATVDAVAILDSAGFEIVIVETVGVGQDEVEIVKTADVSVVVLVPGMGDDIQAIKAGIMEIGDVFVINKADREGVFRTEKELESLLALAHRHDFWDPPIVKTIATENKGIENLSEAIYKYKEFRETDKRSLVRKTAVAKFRIVELLRERLLSQAIGNDSAQEQLEKLALKVAEKELDPYSAVEELIQ